MTEHWRNAYKDYNIDVCNLYDIVMLWMWISLSNAVLGLNVAKNMYYFKGSFKWKLFKIEFCIRSPGARMYPPFPHPHQNYDHWKTDMVGI